MYVCGTEITGREVLLALAFTAISLSIGFSITGLIQERADDTNVLYSRALRITDKEEFEDAIDIKYGNVLVEGEATTVTGVSCEYLTGEYASIILHKEYYEENVTTTTDDEGNTVSTTDYDWERHGDTFINSNNIHFMGQTLGGDNINLHTFSSELTASELRGNVNRNYKTSGKYVYLRDSNWPRVGDVRYSIGVIPLNFKCTVFTNTAVDSFVLDEVGYAMYYNKNIEQALKDVENLGKNNTLVFWLIWALVVVCGVVIFVSLDNFWLHD